MKKKVQDDNSIFTGVGAIVDGNDMWILSEDMEVLIHFDFLSMKLLDYHVISKEKIIQCEYLCLQKIENNIYIIPYKGKNLVSFNIVSGELRYIEIPYNTDESDKNSKFFSAIVWKSYLVLVGCSIRGIFYYDMISDSFIRDEAYLEKLEKLGCDFSKLSFNDNYYQNDKMIYIPTIGQNFILEINLENHTSKVYELQQKRKIELCTIDGFYYEGKEKFLLTTINDEMIIWSPEGGIEKLKELNVLSISEKSYKRAFRIKGKNYYIPACERKIFVEIDGIIKELEFEYESKGGVNETSGYTQFEAVLKKDNDIYFQARSNGQLFRIDTEVDKIYRMDFNVTSDKKEEIIYQAHNGREISILNEKPCLRLDRFLKMITV